MNRHNRKLFAVALLASATVAMAREPFTKEELKAMDEKLTASAKRGYDMWYGARADMANNGLACANCHPDAAATNPHTFPKFMPQTDKVMAYRDMVNWCIENPQGGTVARLKSIVIGTLPSTASASLAGRSRKRKRPAPYDSAPLVWSPKTSCNFATPP